jgi:hypothetical protein
MSGWDKSQPSDYYPGDSNERVDAWTSVKTNDEGDVTDITVGRTGEGEHDHYYNIDQSGPAGAEQRVDWTTPKDDDE